MTSSYTTNLSLEKPGNGDYNNTWNVPVNADWDIVDQAIGGHITINVVGASGTIVLASTTYRNRVIILSGALTANVNYQIPSGVGGFWFIYNNTSGAFSVTISSGGGGSSLVIPQGYTSSVICDGTGIGLSSTISPLLSGSYADPSWITSLSAAKLTGSVAVAAGGTGATTAATARSNLGAAASGTNTDITSLNAGSGIQVGTPTSGAMGVGSINATALYVNGTPVGVSTGSVSSVAMSVPSFLSVTGSPITTSGTLAVSYSGIALPVANGGTGGTTAATARASLDTPSTGGSGATGTWPISISGSAASASSLSSVLDIAGGGTGQTSAAAALAALGGLGVSASALSSPGYIKLSNGFMIQWGISTQASAVKGTYTTSYPTSFTSFSIPVMSGLTEPGNTAGQLNSPMVSSGSTTGFAWQVNATCSQAFWIAVGV